jgi:hypothetical protein
MLSFYPASDGLAGPAASGDRLVPARTYAVIVGVLSFKDPGLSGWSTEARHDRALYDHLLDMGVPAKQMILLLDNAATTPEIHTAINKLAGKTEAGDTFIFYYAGHGLKDTNGKTWFASYEISSRKPALAGLSVDGLGPLLAKLLSGANILLFADCCYSGSLAAVADHLEKDGNRVAAITSAAASNISTGTWAFTMTLLDCLAGVPLADRDRDQQVELGELAAEVRDNLKYRASQRAGTVLRGLPEEWRLAVVSGNVPPVPATAKPDAYGDFLSVAIDGKPATVRRMEQSGAGFFVDYWGYCDRHRIEVAKTRLRPVQFRRYEKGQHLDVLWGGQQYAAKVLKVDGDFHLITYPGWPDFWNEWILSDRIIGITKAPDTGKKEEKAQVTVEWEGSWWPATVLQIKDGKYLIHYLGYDNTWDEWVTDKRLKFLSDE